MLDVARILAQNGRPIDIFFGSVEYWDANSDFLHKAEAILAPWRMPPRRC